jgi:hypothetical protein
MAIFIYIRSQVITDNLADVMLQLINKMRNSAETFINKQIIKEVKCINGKFDILHSLADITANKPEGIIKKDVYPTVPQETLQNLVKELNSRGKWYQNQVQTKIHSLYSHAHRRILLKILASLAFSSNQSEEDLLPAIIFIKDNIDHLDNKYYQDTAKVPIKAINAAWQDIVKEKCTATSKEQINRFNYEIAILEELKNQLPCKLLWIEGSYRYRNPDEDLLKDFDQRREYYFKLLNLPLSASEFIKELNEKLSEALKTLNDNIASNSKVKITGNKDKARIKISPSEPQIDPFYLSSLHQRINKRFGSVNLIDILKETDFRVNFTEHLNTIASKEYIERLFSNLN